MTPEHTWLTRNTTVEQHRKGIDLGCLPATIQECIKVAFLLEIRYVWVDSLCIIQGDHSDWEAESAKMGGIYRGALLTMAASRSKSSSGGLFNWKKEGSSHHDPFDDSECICVESHLTSGKKSCLYFEHPDQWWEHSPKRGLFVEEVYRSPLPKRAWVYQEQMLSQRTLYFAESQLYWECDHCRLSQDNSRQEHSMKETYSIQNFKKPLTAPFIVSKWYYGAVEAYTKRALSKAEDRLVAISAVAKATYMNRHVGYVAGLWKDCILAGLCWYRDSKGKKDQKSGCPSWSWASQLSSVSYEELRSPSRDYGDEEEKSEEYRDEVLSFRNRDPAVYLAKVLDAQVQLSGKNEYGDVESGQIVLRTWTTAGRVREDRSGECSLHFECYSGDVERTPVVSENSACKGRTGRAVLDDDNHEDQDVMIAMVIGWNEYDDPSWLLLLLTLDMADESKQRYERVGLGIIEDDWEMPNFEHAWKTRDITIV